jgi:hypothetical protein
MKIHSFITDNYFQAVNVDSTLFKSNQEDNNQSNTLIPPGFKWKCINLKSLCPHNKRPYKNPLTKPNLHMPINYVHIKSIN